MQKRTRYARFLVPLLVVSIAGCQLPSLLPKATPTVEVPTTTPLTVPGSTGSYSAKLTEIEELRRKYQTLGVTSEDLIIPGYTSWKGELPASFTLELLAARIEYPIVAGSAHCMVVSVNGKLLSLPLTNKGQFAQFKDGAKYPYFNSGSYPGLNAWLLMYSPDFNLNNSSSAGRYEVVSDPGEAYRYVWDISTLVGSDATMSLQIHNNGVGVNKPIVVRLPKPSLRLEVDTPFFSPNQDGTLDTATGSITAQGPWKLSVVDHGEITTGTGEAPLSWDGTVNGVKLPDGEYTLRLEDANNPSSKAEGKVVIDTVAPKIENVTVDGKADYEITQSIIPEVKATITDELSKFEGGKNVELKFERIVDQYSPKIYDDSMDFDMNSGAFSYRVPLEDDSILYLGDQKVEITARDRAGNKVARTSWFAVGDHTLYSGGIPGNSDPRPTAAVGIRAAKTVIKQPGGVIWAPNTEPAIEPEIPDSFKGKKVAKVDLRKLLYGMKKPGLIMPVVAYAVEGSAAFIGAFVVFDQVFDTALGITETDRMFTIETEFGDVFLSEDTFVSKIMHKHPEVSLRSIGLAIGSLKKGREQRDRSEIWRQTRIRGGLSDDLLLIYKAGDQIFEVPIGKKIGVNDYELISMYGSGVVERTNQWPSLKYQWSTVVKKLAEFYAANNPNGTWEFDNPKPYYRYHLRGEINDFEQLKTYTITKTRMYEYIDPRIDGSAQARIDREIIEKDR